MSRRSIVRHVTGLLCGEHPVAGRLYAGVDPEAHHVEPRLSPTRLGAFVAPYHDDKAARAALRAAGAKLREPS